MKESQQPLMTNDGKFLPINEVSYDIVDAALPDTDPDIKPLRVAKPGKTVRDQLTECAEAYGYVITENVWQNPGGEILESNGKYVVLDRPDALTTQMTLDYKGQRIARINVHWKDEKVDWAQCRSADGYCGTSKQSADFLTEKGWHRKTANGIVKSWIESALSEWLWACDQP